MKSIWQSFVFLVGLLLFETIPEVQCCAATNLTVDLIKTTGANILTDPVGVAKALKCLICAEPCTDLKSSIAISKTAFDLAMIDLDLVFSQSEVYATEVMVKHLANTNPVILTSLIVLLDSFLQGFISLEFILCDTTSFVNSALDKSIIDIERSVSNAQNTITALQQCAIDSNAYVKEDIPTLYAICTRKSLNAFTVAFHDFLAELAEMKYYFPEIVYTIGNCLLGKESNLDLKVALATSRCIGFMEKNGFKEFYDMLSGFLVGSVEVISKLQISIGNIQKCGRFYAEKLHEIISLNNVVCNVNFVDPC